MRRVRFSWIGLVAWLALALPGLLAPGPCEETFNTVDDDDDDDGDDDDGDDDAADDDAADDDAADDDAGDDDSGDDDTGDDDDTSGGWLIHHAWVECDDLGEVSEWGFYAQMSGPCDLATIELSDGAYTEEHFLLEGANYLFEAHPASDFDTGFTCDMAFDIYWWASDLPYEDEAWSSWP